MKPYLRRIFEEIDKESTGEYNQLYKVELKILMNTLSPQEKFIVAKHFVNISWNVGSLSVLSMLQECGILSGTEYILSQENKEHVEDLDHIQLVLSDFIESKYDLLGNFLTNCEFSNNAKLKSFLEDCISRLLKDLESNQNIIKNNYLKEVKPIVDDSVYINFKTLHLTCLLDLDKINTRIAFTELDNWTKSFITENTTFFEILQKLIVNDSEVLQKHLLNPSQDTDFKNWKYFVILLYIGTKFSNEEFHKTIRTHMKNLFKQFISKMTKQLCLTLLLTGRVYCSASGEDDDSCIQNYTQWYKSIFSDMKYTITAKEFKNVMVILTELIEYEKSPKFLQVHASISISPAALCNEIVLKYKSNCRLKILSFMKASKEIDKHLDLNESIIIEDDD